MTIHRPDWQREVKIKSWAKGQELSLILITAPARDKGAAFLKREKELWNWQPRIDPCHQIASFHDDAILDGV